MGYVVVITIPEAVLAYFMALVAGILIDRWALQPLTKDRSRQEKSGCNSG